MIDPKLIALVTALSFGLNPVTLKIGFGRGGRPDTAMTIGLVVAVFMYLALVPFMSLQLELVTVPALVGYILGGLFGTGIGRRWLYIAIDKIGAAPATAIKNAAPVITALLAALVYGESVTLERWAAIGAIVAGVILVTWQPGSGIRQFISVGALAAFGAALSYGVRPLFLKFGLDAANLPLTAALVGAIAALVYAFLAGDRAALRTAYADRGFSLFVFSGVLQAIGFLALSFGLSGGDVTVVYPVTASAPLFTLGFAAVMLRGHERLGWRLVAGVVAVVVGVVAL